MSLIIAIEPDRDQAAQLKDLVRRHTGAELILTETTANAIDAIGQRVPDLVLIPALMSPEDDEALTTALRVTEDTSHVQTLTIPVLGTPQQKSGPGGMLSRLRGQSRPTGPDSCDPKLFAEQITEYLQRIAKDRSNGNGSSGHATHASNRGGSQSGQGASGQSNQSTSGQSTSAPSNQSASRKVKAAAPPPAAKPQPVVDRNQPTAEPPRMVAPAPKPSAEIKPAPPPPVRAHRVIELGPSEIALDEPKPPEKEKTQEPDALEMGLSSLLDRLANEDWSDDPPSTPDVKAPRPPEPKIASPVSEAKRAHVDQDPAQWAELKELESLEYKMPKILPQDIPEAQSNREPAVAAKPPAPASPPPKADPAPTPAGSEWGDLLESLKKDLGK